MSLTIKPIKGPKTKFLRLVVSSGLNESGKQLWQNFVGYINNQSAESILKLAKSNEDDLIFLTKNLENKLSALEKRDQNVWQQIIQDEIEYLKIISN